MTAAKSAVRRERHAAEIPDEWRRTARAASRRQGTTACWPAMGPAEVLVVAAAACDQRVVVGVYPVSGTPNAAYMAWNAHTPRPNNVAMTAAEVRPRSQARPGVLVTSQAPSKEIAPSAGR